CSRCSADQQRGADLGHRRPPAPTTARAAPRLRAERAGPRPRILNLGSTFMDLGLTGKVAVLTGASKGIGYCSALALAREGANVAICARGQEGLDAAARAIRDETGVDVLTLTAD